MFSLFVIELSFGHFNKYWKTHVVRDKIPSNLYDTWMFKQQGATRWNLDWHSTGEQVRLSDCLSSFSISLKKLHLIFGFFGLKSSSSQFVPLSPSPKYDHSRCTSLETLQGWRLPSTMQQHPLTPHTSPHNLCWMVRARARLCVARLAGPAVSGQWRWMALSARHLFKGGSLPSEGLNTLAEPMSIIVPHCACRLFVIQSVAAALMSVWISSHWPDIRPPSRTNRGDHRTRGRGWTHVWTPVHVEESRSSKVQRLFFFFESKFQMFLWTSRSFSGSFLLFPLNLSTNICTSYFPHWKSMCAVYLISVLKIQIMFASSETKCSVLWCSLTGKWTLIQVSQDWLHSSVYF